MDHGLKREINGYLVTIFNEVLRIEEISLRQSDFKDLSIKEMHTIEAIGLSGKLSSNEIAKNLNITPGTVSVSVQKLVNKGYVERVKLKEDRRVVRLKLTRKGKLLYRLHHKFHMDMVDRATEGLDKQSVESLIQGLKNIYDFLIDLKENNM